MYVDQDILPAGIKGPVLLCDLEEILKNAHKQRTKIFANAGIKKTAQKPALLTWNPAKVYYRSVDERGRFYANWVRMVILSDRLEKYNDNPAILSCMPTALHDPNKPARHRYNVIVDQVCKKHKVTKRDIESGCREIRCVNPRREIAYRAKYELSMSLPDIGRRMGGRDHTTILNNIRNWERLVKIKNGNGKFDHLKKNNDDKFDWSLIE